MRPTNEALIRKFSQDIDLLALQPADMLSDEAFLQRTNDNTDKVIYSIAKANEVATKLFLTSHQFTNVVGTDIYIYIGNNPGQDTYQMLLDEMSKIRRLDEKLMTFLRDECNDSLTEIHLTEELPDKVIEKVDEVVTETPHHLIYSNISGSLINRGISDVLLENHFNMIGDTHIFIYNDNAIGAQMISRLSQESFTALE